MGKEITPYRPLAKPQVGDLVQWGNGARPRWGGPSGGTGLVITIPDLVATVAANGRHEYLLWWELKVIHRAEGNAGTIVSLEEWERESLGEMIEKKEQQ